MIHRRYNPEGITAYNIVPGLLGVILTMTLVMMTALAVTRERERGTMENLLATPVRPIEVMVGKLAPYVLIGCVQIDGDPASPRKILFDVPIVGSCRRCSAVGVLLFITVNLALGFTFSTLAQHQLQAMQMSFFFLLPSILLSGFMFPFRGMPGWAQAIGECIPVTHFLRIVRGLMLKGAELRPDRGRTRGPRPHAGHRLGRGHQPLPGDAGLVRERWKIVLPPHRSAGWGWSAQANWCLAAPPRLHARPPSPASPDLPRNASRWGKDGPRAQLLRTRLNLSLTAFTYLGFIHRVLKPSFDFR